MPSIGIMASAHVEATAAAVVYSDDFNRADGALGSPWVQVDTGTTITVSGNKAVPGFAALTTYRYNQTFSNDQWAECDVALVPGSNGNSIGPCVRLATAANQGVYFFNYGSSTGILQIYRRDAAGSYAQVGTDVANSLSSFKARLEAEGTTLRLFKNDVKVLEVTDTSVASGQPGLLGQQYTTPTNPSADNFRCGNLPYVPVTVYADNFNRADASTLGVEWFQQSAGNWTTFGNQARRATTGSDHAIFLHDVGSTDMWVEADCYRGGGYNVLNLRSPAPNGTNIGQNLYMGFVNPGGGYDIGVVVGGSYATVVHVAGGGEPSPTKVRFEAQGNALRLYADGVLKIDTTHGAITSGSYAGINASNATDNQIDNFRCGPLPYTPVTYVPSWVGSEPIAGTADNSQYTLGTRFTVNTTLTLYGMRVWNPGTAPALVRNAHLWSDAGTLLYTKADFRLTTAGFTDVVFATPQVLTPGTYVIGININGSASSNTRDYGAVSGGTKAPSYSAALITFPGEDWGRFATAAATMPNTSFGNAYYGVNPLVGVAAVGAGASATLSRAWTNISTTTGTAKSITLAGAAAAGDVIICVVASDAAISVPPSGYTKVVGAIDATEFNIYAKIAAGGETTVTFTIATSAGCLIAACVVHGLSGASIAAMTDATLAKLNPGFTSTIGSTGSTELTTAGDTFQVAAAVTTGLDIINAVSFGAPSNGYSKVVEDYFTLGSSGRNLVVVTKDAHATGYAGCGFQPTGRALTTLQGAVAAFKVGG